MPTLRIAPKGAAMADTADAPLSHPPRRNACGLRSVDRQPQSQGNGASDPAGLICTGIAGVAVLVAATMLVRTATRPYAKTDMDQSL